MLTSINLLFFRYISLIMTFITIIFNIDFSKSMLLLIIFLFLIINNQVRIFFLSDNKNLLLLSIFIELFLIYFSICNLGGNIVFYLLPIMLDIIFLFSNRTTIILSIFILILLILVGFEVGFINIASESLIIFLFYLLCLHIKKENKTKLDAQQLYDKLRISEDKLLKANTNLELYANTIEEVTILKERNRISREIHDSVGHALSAAIIQLNAIEELTKKSNPEVSSIAVTLRDFINNSLQEVRMAVRELKPSNFSQFEDILKLEELINKFSKLTGINTKFILSKDPWQLSNKQYSICYRIIQESLSNSLKHGKATKIDIFIIFSDTEAALTIKDNGCGCSTISKGFGLTGISERIKEIDGTLKLESNINNGFIIKVNFPKKGRDFLDE